MRFTSIDIECNQPSGRIIQLGAAVFDTDRGLISTWSNYVNPGEVINWGHTLNVGCSLEELLAPGFRDSWHTYSRPTEGMVRDFWRWHKDCQAGKKFIQWGRGDMAQVVVESQGCGYPSHLRVLDLKQVYQFLWQPGARLQKQSGLSTACQQMGVVPPSPAHDALNDAIATGELFLCMYKQVAGLNQLMRDLK